MSKTTEQDKATAGYACLDTYEADLLNETPSRRESVTEIQCRDAGELLCYANPERAALIVRAVNEHAALMAVSEAAEHLDNVVNEPSLESDIVQVSDDLRKALATLAAIRKGLK